MSLTALAPEAATSRAAPGMRVRRLGLADYVPTYEAMRRFTDARDARRALGAAAPARVYRRPRRAAAAPAVGIDHSARAHRSGRSDHVSRSRPGDRLHARRPAPA